MFFKKKKKKTSEKDQNNKSAETNNAEAENTDEAEENNKEIDQEPVSKNKKKSKKLKYIIIPIIIVLISVTLIILRKEVPPLLELSSKSLDFGNKVTNMTFTIKNAATANGFLESGVNPITFEIKTEAIDKWITALPISGDHIGRIKIIDVTINRDMLDSGSHMGELRIFTNAGNGIVKILAQKDIEKITITSPTQNSSFFMENKMAIDWTASSGVSSFINIFLYLNGSKVGTIVDNYDFRENNNVRGRFNWNIDNDSFREAKNYTIRIVDAEKPGIFDEIGPIKIMRSLTAIQVLNETTDHQFPSTVQFTFSLRNQDNHAILIESEEVNWKNIKIWENEKEIDYLESHALFYTQDDFQLQVMFVLDFSASMYETKDDIDNMVLSVKDMIDSLKETHQVGVVEFHRPDNPPALLQPFTTYKNAAKEALDNFSSGKIYRDFSICWDAVQKGLNEFSDQPDPDIFKTLLFLSDGFDNSSFCTPKDIIALANEKDVHIFVVGVGEVHEEDVLQGIALKTGGTYVHSENISVLRERFKQSIKDVKGQYKIKYISPKKPEDGKFTVKSNITYKGVTSGPLLHDEIDPSSIFNKTINGIVRFSAPSIIKYNRAEIFVWCEHVPRYINEFKFRIDLAKPFKVYLTSSNDGGLCQDWILDKGTDGWYRLTSPNRNDPRQNLEFGDFGTVCKIVVTDIDKKGFVIPFKLDNTVYDMGQAFYEEESTSQAKKWTTNIRVGNIPLWKK
ncbi:MAG: vWA domain-containing protein [Candidatus Anammoxibacter sp.]